MLVGFTRNAIVELNAGHLVDVFVARYPVIPDVDVVFIVLNATIAIILYKLLVV
jgi:hypothetical protein